MAKYCPVLKRKVTYLDCQDCEEKECEEPHWMDIKWNYSQTRGA